MGRRTVEATQKYNRDYYYNNIAKFREYARINRERIREYRRTHAKEAAELTRKWRESHLEQRKFQEKRSKMRKQEFFWSLKQKPCTDCHIQFHPVAMDFDHLPGYEKLSINGFTGMSNTRLVEETKKCELVCANCHRIRTWKRLHELG